ncbi:hypothetical protein OSB04_019004 [Centaurea solstitialis]|uniref:Drought induced 19 protein type zinc-binding domain-containing protein n=1 Tax=Centaurea solstitialis TaxID=347529 RepID=A0AA38T102_9ASTR|nr:hypothetical protein OSB04_019004 [Centaurea solstitialis]
MDSDSWIRLSTSKSSSRRYQSRSALDSSFTIYNLFRFLLLSSEAFHLVDEFESDEEGRPEFLCPFCAEDFDIVGLCCHIDEEHTVEAKNGICPVCVKRVGPDLISHITMQHGSLLKISFIVYSSHFIYITFRRCLVCSLEFGGIGIHRKNLTLKKFKRNLTMHFVGRNSIPSLKPRNDEFLELSKRQEKLSDKDQEEKVRRSEFVQGLLFSTFIHDAL